MTKTIRKDAWMDDEDLMLVDIVLRSIRTGGKRENAWKDAEVQIGRTAGACAFRWNSYLSKKYDTSVEQAKMQFLASKGEEIESGEEDVTTNSRFRKTPVEEKMDEALEATRNNRVGTALIHVPTDIMVHPNTEEEEVTTGIQQALDLDTLEVKDDVVIPKIVNPFEKILQYVKGIEKEYDNDLNRYDELVKMHTLLVSKNNELETRLSEANSTVARLQEENMDKDEEIRVLKEQLDSLNEIKELVVHFQNMNK
jgi:prespore-specific regulator